MIGFDARLCTLHQTCPTGMPVLCTHEPGQMVIMSNAAGNRQLPLFVRPAGPDAHVLYSFGHDVHKTDMVMKY